MQELEIFLTCEKQSLIDEQRQSKWDEYMYMREKDSLHIAMTKENLFMNYLAK